MVSNYKFTDQEHDPETGLYNYDARLYDPVIGGFISVDPIAQENIKQTNKHLFDPRMLNRYSYVRNNPLNFVDPDGYEPSKNRLGNSGRVIERLKAYKGDSVATFKWASTYKSFGYAKVRYIYSQKYGYIDLTHFFRAAEMQHQYSEKYKDTPVINSIVKSGKVIELGGYWNEIDQTFSSDENVRKSAWSYEDIPSNKAGIEFGKTYDPSKPFYKQVNEYLKDIKVQSVNEIKTTEHYKNLPQEEPAYGENKK